MEPEGAQVAQCRGPQEPCRRCWGSMTALLSGQEDRSHCQDVSPQLGGAPAPDGARVLGWPCEGQAICTHGGYAGGSQRPHITIFVFLGGFHQMAALRKGFKRGCGCFWVPMRME